ncbi:MAG: kynureninase [Alphaproteobacteria bacterium]
MTDTQDMTAFWRDARARAAALDAADPLAATRALFHLPEGLIYLDGNSLGPAPKAAFAEVEAATRGEWAEGLIRSWNAERWFDLPAIYGDRLARLIGAGAGEVVVCDTVSVNIAKALHAALALRPERPVIVTEGAGFHTDRYIAEGVAATRPGVRLALGGRDAPRIEDLIGADTAVVLVNHVDYRSGAIRDMAALTAAAHDAGALVIWDLCHSVGAMPVELNAAGADLAVGCTYKYLNGGPGAPAFVFCAGRHIGDISQPLSGWWGHAAPFAFEPGYRAAPGIAKFLCGTQPILSMRALSPALDVFEGLDMGAVRAKSMALTSLFIELAEASCGPFGITLASPRQAGRRGSQVALGFEHAYPVMQALIAAGVIGDFRAPDILRFGFAPLYVSFTDTCRAAETLHRILVEESWRDVDFQVSHAVT